MMVRRLRAVLACAAALSFATATGAQEPDPWFARVSARAQALAAEPYRPPADLAVPSLKDLTYDRYRDIRFRKDQALWRGETPFEVELFHPGFLYLQPVTVNIVENGNERRLAFDPAMFDYGKSGVAGPLPGDLGFAGFRLHYPLNRADYKDEVMAFLGASYFRVLGRGQVYGLSARGLAIGTATPGGEEFPRFREFWLVKPSPDATSLRIFALLDSKSATGAFQFDVRPGRETTVDVKTDLFIRADVPRLGIAPLASMYLHGDNPPTPFDDYRPRVHDSDGLLLRSSAEWTWRPLANPTALRVSSFMDQNVIGFGLLQRERSFESYLDLESHFERRPGIWIEPQGGPWQNGATYLVEIPVKEEIHDNIVSFWSPPGTAKAGTKLTYTYRLRTVDSAVVPDHLARVVRSTSGWAAVPGAENPPSHKVRRFVVGFQGGGLRGLDGSFPVNADLTASTGSVKDLVIQKEPAEGTWRASFQIVPDGDKPSDIRLFLTLNGQRLSETWSYAYYPKDHD